MSDQRYVVNLVVVSVGGWVAETQIFCASELDAKLIFDHVNNEGSEWEAVSYEPYQPETFFTYGEWCDSE